MPQHGCRPQFKTRRPGGRARVKWGELVHDDGQLDGESNGLAFRDMILTHNAPATGGRQCALL